VTGTFSSLTSALSALRYQRVAMDTASNNIANVNSEGYVRRRAEAQSVGAPTHVALWSRYDGVGDGVSPATITRMAESFLDLRSRRENGKQSLLDTRVSVLDRVETGIAEPGDHGVSAAMDDFRNAWQDLQSHPEQASSRNLVLANGAALADTIKAQASNLTSEMSDQRGHALDLVSDVNATAKSLAAVNASIADARAAGLEDYDLVDQRDLLALKLAKLSGGEARVGANGALDVTVGGVPLVAGPTASTLTVTGGIAPDGSATATPLAFTVVGPTGSTPLSPAVVGGELGGVSELLTGTLPNYLTGLDTVAKTLADSVNALHTTGYDQNGNPGQPFFSYGPGGAATTLAVAITDPAKVAASSLPGVNTDGGVAEALGDLDVADSAYQSLVNGFGIQVQSSKRSSDTQQVLTIQVDSSREQLVGVNFDEETVNLLAAQRGYEAAARVMSVMDSILDTLINRTGVN
jgi:flagellar hook-associated protein 1 FlgK